MVTLRRFRKRDSKRCKFVYEGLQVTCVLVDSCVGGEVAWYEEVRSAIFNYCRIKLLPTRTGDGRGSGGGRSVNTGAEWDVVRSDI